MKGKEIAEGLRAVYGESLSSNVYLVSDPGKGTLAIDAGAARVLDSEPSMLVLTHAHYDHSGGVDEGWRNVYLHRDDFGGGPFFNVPENAKPLDMKRILWGSFELEVLHTPGHTMGSICLFEKRKGILFSGDTLFADGIGRTDLGGDWDMMQNSLSVIDKLGWKLLCPGHGDIAQR